MPLSVPTTDYDASRAMAPDSINEILAAPSGERRDKCN